MKDYVYCVLYTPVIKMAEVRDALHEILVQEGRGVAFCPSIEFWRRDRKQWIVKTLFPGYVFIRSDMDLRELHALIGRGRERNRAYIRELGLQEKRAGSMETPYWQDDGYQISDLNEEESSFMDFLLDLTAEEERIAGCSLEMGTPPLFPGVRAAKERDGPGLSGVPPASLPVFGKTREYRLGLLRASAGYREDGRYYVMEGPLKPYEDRIRDVNRHERRAYLDLAVNGNRVVAGFEAKPKSCWFPEEKDAPEVLEDGTEVDIRMMAKKMMGG